MSEIYALCAVVAMQKYRDLDAVDYSGFGHAYHVIGWHDAAVAMAIACLEAHKAER